MSDWLSFGVAGIVLLMFALAVLVLFFGIVMRAKDRG